MGRRNPADCRVAVSRETVALGMPARSASSRFDSGSLASATARNKARPRASALTSSFTGSSLMAKSPAYFETMFHFIDFYHIIVKQRFIIS
jgi:hypothetical protein